MTKINYKESGVNIAEGNRAVDLIKEKVKSTYSKNVIGELGLFSGGFSLKEYMYMEEPTLLAATDGVGTKLLIAQNTNSHNTVGIDLVAMCVNDLICQGAKPLFFLDYIATGKVNPEKISEIVSGIADGCIESGCSLIGGETAEMPGMYQGEEYDLGGFAVGIVDKNKIIDGTNIKVGDKIIGLGSSGLHSNGYSLARKLFFEKLNLSTKDTLGSSTVGDLLIKPTRIYVKPVLDLIERFNIKGIANITGGGLVENVPRILPKGLKAIIDKNSWDYPEIFKQILATDLVEIEDLYLSLNMGIGMVLIVEQEEVKEILSYINRFTGEKAWEIGEIALGENVCQVI